MIHNLKPYPAYIDSGIPWLEKVPEHWEQLPGRACFTKKKVPNIELQEKTVLSLSYGKIVIKPAEKLHGLVPESFETYQIIEPNDIIIRSTDLQNDQNSLRFGFAKTKGIITSAYMCFQTKKFLTPEYGHLLLHTYDLMKIFYGLGSGLRQNLDWRDFKYLPLPVPPLPEQSAIVHYLDYIDRRIRRYIRAKQKLIKLLEEQKQAIIHQAVTRGLDPSVKLKPSGVEWFGDVPEHWEVRQLGRCLKKIEQGWSPVAAEGELIENQWAVLTLSSVKRGIFNSKAIKPIAISAEIPMGIELCSGDFLLTRSNTRNLVGDVCIVDTVRPKTIICDLIYRLQIDETILEPRFLMYQLLAPFGRWQIEQDARGSSGTMPKISQRHIKAWKILLPSIEEQQSITKNIDNEIFYIDNIIRRIESEIGFFREYRTRLIADVVTGKLDVREAAANLPEETEEIETSDDALDEDEELENNEIENEQAGELEEEVIA